MAVMLAAAAAPAIVRAGSLMRINPRIIVPPKDVSGVTFGYDIYERASIEFYSGDGKLLASAPLNPETRQAVVNNFPATGPVKTMLRIPGMLVPIDLRFSATPVAGCSLSITNINIEAL